MSEREEQIFVQEYQNKVIPIDSLTTLNSLFVYFEETYCENNSTNWPFIYYDMKEQKAVSKSNRNTIKIGVEPPPCMEGKMEYDDRMILEIIKDGYNTTIETINTEIDSIPSFVKKQMLSWGKDPNYAIGALNNGIWICTKKDDELSKLNIYIYKVIEGYLESLREYSNAAYSKDIDDLSKEEYQEIAEEFVFRLAFKYTDEDIKININF